MLTEADLAQFCGTENYYQHWLKRFVYTDGVKYLADEGGAHWLLDAIASHQTRNLLSDPMLQEIQFWELEVNENNSAVLRCLRDTDDVALTQEIELTNFPLNVIKLYLVRDSVGDPDSSRVTRVLMLPSEY